MPKLIFAAADVRRVVEHSLAAPKQNPVAYTKNPVQKPAVVLVHDHGVYLMSNGSPRDAVKKTSPNGKAEIDSSFCAFARGCDPEKDGDAAFDNSNDLVGGDDFADTLQWAEAIKKMLDDGATAIVVNFGSTRMSLAAVYPKGKKPQPERVAWTVDTLVKHLQKTLRRRLVAFNPKTNALDFYKAPDSPALRARLLQKNGSDYLVLNGASLVQLVNAVDAYLKAKAAKPAAQKVAA